MWGPRTLNADDDDDDSNLGFVSHTWNLLANLSIIV